MVQIHRNAVPNGLCKHILKNGIDKMSREILTHLIDTFVPSYIRVNHIKDAFEFQGFGVGLGHGQSDFNVMFIITDDFEGGEMLFKEIGLTARPDMGSMVVFPEHEKFKWELANCLGRRVCIYAKYRRL